ncbi:MAG TPA: hypothetical protein VGQ57_19140 [Polyangiaceae bacterium]|jgi:hypothetical protein|nr:hypothetical protein [Polyangiaceae bacterium]
MTDRALMGRVANAVNVALFLAACASFALGLYALGDRRDLQAIYWLIVGGISLRAASDMLRPRSPGR